MEKQRYASFQNTLAIGGDWNIPVYGRWLTILYNSITTDPEVSFDNAGSFYRIPAGVSVRTETPFSKLSFRNTSASTMVLWVAVSDGAIYDNRVVLGASGAGSLVPILDITDDISTPAAITVLNLAGFLINAAVAVNKGGGKVGIPLTAQPFSTGDGVTITGCPQYNGAYTVDATSSANEVVITATFKGGLINNAAAVDKGAGKVGIPITGHPYGTGEKITITNTVNYNATYTVDATSSVNEVVITAAYVAEVFDGVNDSHNLTFDGTNDKIGLTTARSIAADTTRKELHIRNHDTMYKVFFGDGNVNAANYRGLAIEPESTYIITCTDIIYLDCESAAGVTGCKVSWGNFTKT